MISKESSEFSLIPLMWIINCRYLLRYLLPPTVGAAGNALRPVFFVAVLQLEPQNLETKRNLKGKASGTQSKVHSTNFDK